MPAKIAFDCDHSSWYFPVVSLCTYMLLFPPWGCKSPLWVPVRAAWAVRVHFLLDQYRLLRGQGPTLHRRSLCLRVGCRWDNVHSEGLGLATVPRKYTCLCCRCSLKKQAWLVWNRGVRGGKDLYTISSPFHCQLWLRRLAQLVWFG